MLTLFEMFRTLLLLLVVIETHGSDNGKLCNCFGMVELLQCSVVCVFVPAPACYQYWRRRRTHRSRWCRCLQWKWTCQVGGNTGAMASCQLCVCVWEGEGVRLHVCNTSFTGSTGTVSLAGDKGSQTMDGLNVAPTDPSQGPRDATTPDPSGAKMDSLVLRSKFKKELVWLPVSNGTLIHSAL